MDEGLAWIFLALGLGIVLVVFITVALIVYYCQKRKRKVHVEKATIADSFDSSSPRHSKFDEFDIKTSSPRSYLHVFEGQPMYGKNYLAPSPPIEKAPETPVTSISLNEETKLTELPQVSEVKHELEPTLLTSVVVIDDYPPDPPKTNPPPLDRNNRRMITNYFLESSVEEADVESPPEPTPDVKPTVIVTNDETKERPFFINLKEATEKCQKLEVSKGSATINSLVEKQQSPSEDDHENIYAEFEALNKNAVRKSCSEAELPSNIRKNRFYDILPYDYNRVRLNHIEPTKSDYINATYVKNDLGQITHIAAQGPIGKVETLEGRRDSTISDFWEMIWQEEVECVVMLTLCVEGLRHKCAIYWPENAEEPENITDFLQMTMCCVTEDEICFQRDILLEKTGHKSRMVTQWHYKDWLDCAAPENSEILLSFLQRIRERNYKRPILVHCSAGVGRTGVFITLDLLLDNLDKSKPIDVFEMVKMLRETRVNMVRTPDQYATIYETIAMAIRNRQNLFSRNNSNNDVLL